MPAPPARKARTRQEILDHAARLFRLRGYEATTIDDVMLAAGLTRGAFYAHFDSKDAPVRRGIANQPRPRCGCCAIVPGGCRDTRSRGRPRARRLPAQVTTSPRFLGVHSPPSRATSVEHRCRDWPTPMRCTG